MNHQKDKREKVAGTSGDVLEAPIAKLRSLFPEVVVEGKKTILSHDLGRISQKACGLDLGVMSMRRRQNG